MHYLPTPTAEFSPQAADALAFSLLLMTQVEGHRSFDLRLSVDYSVPRSTHRSPFRRTLLRWRRREFRLLRRWKGGESFALPYHRGRPVDRGGALPPPKAEVVSSNLAGSAN